MYVLTKLHAACRAAQAPVTQAERMLSVVSPALLPRTVIQVAVPRSTSELKKSVYGYRETYSSAAMRFISKLRHGASSVAAEGGLGRLAAIAGERERRLSMR